MLFFVFLEIFKINLIYVKVFYKTYKILDVNHIQEYTNFISKRSCSFEIHFERTTRF